MTLKPVQNISRHCGLVKRMLAISYTATYTRNIFTPAGHNATVKKINMAIFNISDQKGEHHLKTLFF